MTKLPDWATPALAFDLVANLLPRAVVCRMHGVSRSELIELAKLTTFRQMLMDAKKQWDAPAAADERIRVKARMAQEGLLEDMYEIGKSANSADSDRIAAYKIIMTSAEIPGSGRATSFGGASGSNFSITINLEGAKPTVLDMERAPAQLVDGTDA